VAPVTFAFSFVVNWFLRLS